MKRTEEQITWKVSTDCYKPAVEFSDADNALSYAMVAAHAGREPYISCNLYHSSIRLADGRGLGLELMSLYAREPGSPAPRHLPVEASAALILLAADEEIKHAEGWL